MAEYVAACPSSMILRDVEVSSEIFCLKQLVDVENNYNMFKNDA